MYENNQGLTAADVGAVLGRNGYGNNGMFGDGAWWIIILFLFAINGGWGNGMFGGGNAMPYMMGNASSEVQRGFDQSAVMSAINAVTAALNAAMSTIQTAIAGVVTAINSGFAQAEASANNRQIANMQGNFALQQGISNLGAQFQQCCCDNRAAVADLKYTVATEACADRAAVEGALRDVTAQGVANTQLIMNTINGGIQSIKDEMCQDRFNNMVNSKDAQIADLTRRLNERDREASNNAQNGFFQNALNQAVRQLQPNPVPAYPAQYPQWNGQFGNNCNCGCPCQGC